MYLSYDEYTNMGGSLTAAAYPRYEKKAAKIIDYYTCQRFADVNPLPEEVKYLMYELITKLVDTEDKGTVVASESNDGTSITYVQKDQNAIGSEYWVLIKTYLADIVIDGVPVLYKGVYHAQPCV